MRTLRMVCMFAALLAVQGIASAADASGKWVAQQMREGHAVTIEFDFKVNGDKLTGTMSPAGKPSVITDGKVTGNNISFAIVRTVEEKTFRVEYAGTVEGDDMKLAIMRDGKKLREFTAKRSK